MVAGSTTVGLIILLVVDASVAVKFVTREAGSEAALKIIAGPEALIAPDWVMVECANVFWKKVKHSLLLELHAHRALHELPDFFAAFYPDRALLSEAFRLSFRLRHAVYDCLYLALALQEEAGLVTADQGLKAAADAGGLGDRVTLLRWTS